MVDPSDLSEFTLSGFSSEKLTPSHPTGVERKFPPENHG